MRIPLLALLAFSASACTFSPSISPDEAGQLRGAVQPLLEIPVGGSRILAQAEWPQAVLEILDPIEVYLHADGLYVTTSETFVESQGIFFPRDQSFRAVQGNDPEFVKVIPGVYKFHIRG